MNICDSCGTCREIDTTRLNEKDGHREITKHTKKVIKPCKRKTIKDLNMPTGEIKMKTKKEIEKMIEDLCKTAYSNYCIDCLSERVDSCGYEHNILWDTRCYSCGGATVQGV